MVVSFCRLDDHIIDIYLKVSPDLVGKDNVHESLVCGANIFEVEGHGVIVVVAMV